MSRDWLVNWRKERSLNQTETAKASGIAPARFSRIEHGYCDIRPEEADALARVLKVSREAVLTGVRAVPVAARTPATVNLAPPKPTAAVAVVSNVVSTPIARNDDLNDPKNFAFLPPTALLKISLQDAGALPRLREATRFAEKVLHTSKVRPAVWVAWRDFLRDGQAHMKGELLPNTSAISAPIAPQPIVSLKSEHRPEPPIPNYNLPANTRTRGNKNVYGHFFDVARELLSKDLNALLTEKATEAKQKQPEVGFMKHYRRLAQETLTPAVLEKIDHEATRRATGEVALNLAS